MSSGHSPFIRNETDTTTNALLLPFAEGGGRCRSVLLFAKCLISVWGEMVEYSNRGPFLMCVNVDLTADELLILTPDTLRWHASLLLLPFQFSSNENAAPEGFSKVS
jgi:hypothetical protein